MRAYCATFYGETNTFSPLRTGREDFAPMALAEPGTASFAAAFAPVHEMGGEVVGRFNRAALPGGIVMRAAYESMREELLNDLASQMPVDFLALNLHGAMVADGCSDCEGDILGRIRAFVGDATPIVASLDPHAHLSAAMLASADVLIAYREYPHTDEAATFAEAVRLGLSTSLHHIRPCMAAVACGQIAEYHTTREPMLGIVADMRAWQRLDSVLAVSLIHGFPWGDVPDMGTSSLVVTDSNPALGHQIAEKLAMRVRAVRGQTSHRVLPFDEALSQARALQGPVVVADVSDNPGGGAPGDSTFLLQWLLERSVLAAFGPMWDPFAASQAHKAGAGARMTLRLGGKTGAVSGEPLDGDALVIATSEHLRTDGVGGYEVSYGRSASLRLGSVEIVVTSEREQAMSPSMFAQLGVKLDGKHIVVVKSAQHFRAQYEGAARAILYASSPGALNLDFASLPYRAANRNLWPLTR